MKKSEELPISEPRRQSEYAIALILWKFLKNLFRQGWPLILVIFFSRKGTGLTLILVGIFLAIAIVSFLISMMSYYQFYYYVKGEELHIKKGVFRKTEIQIPFNRIQSVDFQQNVIHQLFGVVSLKVDTAGSKTQEISFDALSKEDAQFLRNYILRKKAETEQGVEEGEISENFEEEAELVLALTPLDLFKIGISQNHLRTAGLLLAAGITLLENIDQFLPFNLFEMVNEEAESWIKGSLIIVLVLVPAFLLISFLITLFTTVLKYYNLKFWKTGKGFKLISGLVNRKEYTARTKKIQIFSWSTNPLKRLFRIFTIKLYKADSEDVLGEKSITVPGCYSEQVGQVRDFIMPGVSESEFARHPMHWLIGLRFFLISGILPCVIATIIALISQNNYFFAVWLYLPLAIWMAILYYRKKAIRLHPRYLIADGGIFGEEHKLMENFKIQSVQLRQHFFQKRRNLGDLLIYTASGAIKLRFLPIDKARAMYDYFSYSVEADRREWM